VAELVEALHYKLEGRGFYSNRIIGIFQLLHPSGCSYGPGFESACKINEHQGYLLGLTGGRRVQLTAMSRNSESLNLAGATGPVRACTGLFISP
jgi:hypothetical protein